MCHVFVTALIGHMHNNPHVPQFSPGLEKHANITMLGIVTSAPADGGLNPDSKG